MAHVRLRSPLRELAGGESEVDVEGTTLGEVIRRLERSHPRLSGWVLDEQGSVRQHVHLFVNGERAALDASVSPADRIQVIPAISGGAVPITERPATARFGHGEEQA